MWESFPFLGGGRAKEEAAVSPRAAAAKTRPSLKVSLEKKVHRPGDTVTATAEIHNEAKSEAVLMEDLSVEVRGIEKLDPQWLVTPKPPAGSKSRRGSPEDEINDGGIAMPVVVLDH